MVCIGVSVRGACQRTSLRLLEQLHSWSCINIELRNLSPVIIRVAALFDVSDCYSLFWNKGKIQDTIVMTSIIPNVKIPNYYY